MTTNPEFSSIDAEGDVSNPETEKYEGRRPAPDVVITPTSPASVYVVNTESSAAASVPTPPPLTVAVSSDPPPSYESVVGRVKRAKEDSSGFFNFCWTAYIILMSTVGCTIALAFTLLIPITLIVIGAVYKNDCRAQPAIPVFLIVGGSVGILENLMKLASRKLDEMITSKGGDEDEETLDEEDRLKVQRLKLYKRQMHKSDLVMSGFFIAWLIAGCYWVYGTQPHFEQPDNRHYCHPTVYNFTWWMITLHLVVVPLVLLCLCCVAVAKLSGSDD